MSRRISVTIDSEIEDILRKNKIGNEGDGPQITRMLKEAHQALSTLKSISLESEKHHAEVRNMLSQFLEQVRNPFDQISGHLSDISERLEN